MDEFVQMSEKAWLILSQEDSDESSDTDRADSDSEDLNPKHILGSSIRRLGSLTENLMLLLPLLERLGQSSGEVQAAFNEVQKLPPTFKVSEPAHPFVSLVSNFSEVLNSRGFHAPTRSFVFIGCISSSLFILEKCILTTLIYR